MKFIVNDVGLCTAWGTFTHYVSSVLKTHLGE